MKSFRVKRLPRLIAVGLIATALITAALSPWATGPALAQEGAEPSQPPELPSARRGLQIYEANCAPCHGTTGLGNGPSAAGLQFVPTQFADAAVARQASLSEWFSIAKNGRMDRMMPPWGQRLSDQEIWDAVAYAWTLHTDPIELNQGKAIYEAQCASCHGPDGRGAPDGSVVAPDLTSRYDASLAEWFEVISTGRNQMPAFSDSLSEDERWAVAEYARSLGYAPLTAATFEPGDGVVSGAVTNETQGGQGVADVEVTLHVFDAELGTQVRTFTTITGPDGTYRFEGMPTGQEWGYMVTLSYADVPYASEALLFPEGETQLDMPVQVYETTTDGTGIQVERAHWFIEFDGQNLLVGELYIFSMDGNRVYVGAKDPDTGLPVTLRIPLPSGYADLDIEGGGLGQRYFDINGTLVDTLPMPPGSGVRQMLLRYRLPYQSRRMEFKRTTAYPIAYLNVLVNDVGVKVSSDQVSPREPRGIGNTQYLNLVGEGLGPGETVTLSLDQLPIGQVSGDAATPPISTPLIAGLVALVVLLIGAVAYLYWRQRVAAAPSAVAAKDLEVERERLIRLIARLDDEFEAGRIEPAVYERERSRYKAELMALIEQSIGERKG